MSPAASVIARGALNGVSAVWHVAEEIPVAIMLNSEPLAVMMATPHQLDDFAIGFALAEGFLASATAVRGVLTLPAEGGVTVDVSVDEAAVLPRAAPLRGIEGRIGLRPLRGGRDRRRLPPVTEDLEAGSACHRCRVPRPAARCQSTSR